VARTITPGDLRNVSVHLDAGSKKVAADRVAVSEGNLRVRLCRTHQRLGVQSTTVATWTVRHQLEVFRKDGPQWRRDGSGRAGPRGSRVARPPAERPKIVGSMIEGLRK
jgi:hypothetical protein